MKGNLNCIFPRGWLLYFPISPLQDTFILYNIQCCWQAGERRSLRGKIEDRISSAISNTYTSYIRKRLISGERKLHLFTPFTTDWLPSYSVYDPSVWNCTEYNCNCHNNTIASFAIVFHSMPTEDEEEEYKSKKQGSFLSFTAPEGVILVLLGTALYQYNIRKLSSFIQLLGWFNTKRT